MYVSPVTVGQLPTKGMAVNYLVEGLNRKSMVPGCSKVSSSHTYDVLAQIIENTLKENCLQ